MQAFVNNERDAIAIPFYRGENEFIYHVNLRTSEIRLEPLAKPEDVAGVLEYRSLEIPESLGDMVVQCADEALDDGRGHSDRNLAHRTVMDGAAEVAALLTDV